MNSTAKLKIITVLWIIAIITACTLSGCAGTKITVSTKLDSLSLTEMWNAVTSSVDLQEEGAEFDSLYLHSDAERNIDTLSFTFQGWNKKGRPHAYFADVNRKGEIAIRTNEIASVQSTQHPSKVFDEIDKLGLASLDAGENGLSIRIDFQSGDIGYSYNNVDIYNLVDGMLLPLEEIVFHSDYPWCTVSVYKLIPNETVTTEDGRTIAQATSVAGPVPPGERTSQIWFLGDDINKADTINYLDID